MSSTQSTSNRSTERAPRRTGSALTLLKNDHRTVEDLFEEYEHARRADRKQTLVKQICEELTIHAQLEETAFYPEVQAVLKGDTDLVEEAKVEHASLKWLIEQLESEQPDTEQYAAKVTVLKEYVQHHVKEEEREMFPKLRKTDLDLDELGEKLATTKTQLKEKLATAH